MLFRFLGQAVSRVWPFFLVAWVALLVALGMAAPPWGSVARDREFDFLPENSPSRQAESMFARAFPEDRAASNIVLVLHRTEPDSDSLTRDRQFIDDTLEAALRQIAKDEGGLAGEPVASDQPLFADESPFSKESAPEKPKEPSRRSIIARVRTPSSPAGGAFLVSQDGKALLVVVELTNDFLARENHPTIAKVEGLVRDLQQQGKVPKGLNLSVTGSAVIGRDHTVAELQSVRATQIFTFVLVIGLLAVIYRAPLVALIPLITVYVAVQVAVDILAILAGGGHLVLFEGLQIYITILAYGAGVDYSLFLTARYREHLEKGESTAQAVCSAVAGVGPALIASAAAVICGIAMMCFAQFGKFREAGMAIPLSLFFVLLSTLTLSPALLRLAGRFAFWPQHPGPRDAASRPTPRWMSFGSDWLEGLWDRVGQLLLRRAGTVWLVTVALMMPFVVVALVSYNRLSYDLIGALPANSPSVAGSDVLQEHFPAGVVGPVTMLLVDPQLNFNGKEGREVIAAVTEGLHARASELGVADVRSLTAPLGFTAAAKSNPFAGLNLPEDIVRRATARGSRERYLTDFGERGDTGARFDVILDQSPFAHTSVVDLDHLEQAAREALPAGVRHGATLYLSGTTASVRDLAEVIRHDRGQIQILVAASVFVILVLLLREITVPVYLLLSVIFSYLATLGVAFALFWMIEPRGFAGIDWKVAIFLFTILIAVGADYNIFLITRIREEQRRHGPILGITQALDRTGPIISSCGIIMAGTFASLLAGTLTDMRELGFSLAFGVLLDTFVVRPILVPAFLILWQRGQLFPHRRGRVGDKVPSSTVHGHG